MASNVVLLTGVADHVGGRLAARLAADPVVRRVIVAAPRPPAVGLPERVELVVAEPGSPLLVEVLRSAGVETVVYAAPRSADRPSPGRLSEDHDVVATMRLLASCQRAGGVRRLVVRSTTEVYGAGPNAPAVFTEQDVPAGAPRPAALEVEEQARAFATSSPGTTLTVFRLAELLSGRVDSALGRYLSLPVVPTVLGFDARVQFLHHQDAVAVLHRASTHDLPGVFNVAGDGVLLLSQALRRAGRVALPVPAAAVPAAARIARTPVSPGLTRLLSFGRVVDTSRLRTSFGYAPRWSTSAALDDHVHARPPR
ncbi:NAD-dependent epimerase/dehydratase family protein [Actinophytocola xanthii]|uniref:NAD-dependent epimerase/dehydratase domain-containing protein n=1 Tax=Actinophytocola xanthii TaxID=1912961 RepID=A0A1Q8CN37_9PSEU|nr:NAD-dependent epimerase/dehydratase family protein [Actinophytocola xanthii]OLF15764.1 hypothetical protein BU204_20415 [Actinophytocola xanthii]